MSFPAGAELNSASYTLPALIMSSGGATEMSSGSYKLLDSKGFYGGELTGGTVAQLGGIYGLIEFPLPGKGHITGQVTKYNTSPAEPIPGAQITVYTETQIIKTGSTNATGNYQILNINPGDYFIEASADGFFPYRTTLTITADQAVTQNFQLVAGQTAPEGTVWLNITREGTSVALTWPIGILGGQVPWPGTGLDLYALVGTGTGIYRETFPTTLTDTTAWEKVLEDGALTTFANNNEFALSPTGTKLYHNGQISAGAGEVYYKAVLGNIIPTDAHPSGSGTYFSNAPGVGKFDLSLKPGNENLIAVPLVQEQKNPNAVFGINFSTNDTIKTYDNTGQGSWPQSSFGGTSWDNGIANIDENKGYWINVSIPKTATVVGKVKDNSAQYTLKAGNENLLGSPFAKMLLVTNASGTDLLNLGTSVGANVILKTYDNFDQGSWPQAVYTNSNTTWDQGLPVLKAGRGFWINNANNIEKNWTLNP